jgi:outer membrane protein assembly factor BamE (lipoprotein component of BamABCDE complex)
MSKKIKDEQGNTYVKKKPFYKKIWFWLLIIIIIVVAAAMGKGGKSNDSDSQSSKSNSTQVTKKKSTGSSKVNKANFDKIQISETSGTSKEEVRKLFGKKPSTTSTQTIQNIQADAEVWNGGVIGSTITVSFINNHAAAKAIAGLPNDKKVSSAQYDSISNGMSKADVQKKLGKPFSMSYSSLGGQTSETWEFSGKGSLGANVTITFTNGTVSGKSQSGLK